MAWTIKQMARISGISIDSLRYYDKLGVVSPKRMENGYRYYGEKDYIHLQYVTVMKYAHFSLSEIKIIVQSLMLEASDECKRTNLDIFAGKRAELVEMAKNYQQIVKLIDNLLPMVDSSESYLANEEQIEAFVCNIYNQISGQAENR